jgi:hypothetical protein
MTGTDVGTGASRHWLRTTGWLCTTRRCAPDLVVELTEEANNPGPAKR